MNPIEAKDIDAVFVQLIESGDAQVARALKVLNDALARQNNEDLQNRSTAFLQSMNSLIATGFREVVRKAKANGRTSPDQIAEDMRDHMLREFRNMLYNNPYFEVVRKSHLENEMTALFHAAVAGVIKYPNDNSARLSENLNVDEVAQVKAKLQEKWQTVTAQSERHVSGAPVRAETAQPSEPAVEFKAREGRLRVPLSEQSHRTPDEIKSALKILSSNPLAQHSTVTVDKSTKTWEVTMENKSEKPTKLICHNDTRLQINNLNPNNRHQVDAYVKAVIAMATGKVDPLSQLTIMVDRLPHNLAIAITIATAANGIKSSKTLAELGPAKPDDGNNYVLGLGRDSIGVLQAREPAHQHEAKHSAPSPHRRGS